MKHWIASVLLIAPSVLLAASHQATATSKPKSTNQKTATVKKPAPKPQSAARKAAAAGVATGAAAAVLAPRMLGTDELALAERVYTGQIPCELGQQVSVTKDDKNPGHFLVSGKGFNFHMSPMSTTTGVVRLEDSQAGAVWLQIANKSMLMNQKQGKRLADECMSPEQLQVAESIKKAPPKSLLD